MESFSQSPNASVEISGGFGNQLFQLAAAEFLRIRGVNVYLDLRINQINGVRANLISGLAHNLGFQTRKLNTWQLIYWRIPVVRRAFRFTKRSLVIKEDVEFLAPPLILQNQDLIYRGYWQNLEVASTIRNRVSNFFQITDEVKVARIALHVRRGDYLQGGNPKFHGLLTGEYYVSAVEMIRRKLGNLPVVVFTDSKEIVSKEPWLNNILNLSFTESSNAIEDFIEIANSSAIVCSNSTFSWWASYISSARNVVLPSKWQVGLDIPEGLLHDRAQIVTAFFDGQS